MSKPVLQAKDFASDQDLRWCPGCGDFAILKQAQIVLSNIEASIANTVFISGIGCSSRFPYYMNTYGMHSIHGRAAPIASGLRLSRPELDIWVVTGDGDSLSIGGNHLIHLLRRDLNINVMLFNNEIYGLTKGQYSPTSKHKTITKSSPFGSSEQPFNTLALAFGAGATFLARSIDREAKHLQETLTRTHAHQGTSLIEIYQNCHIFNDGAFSAFTDRKRQKINAIFLEQGEPIVFGQDLEFGIKFEGYTPIIVDRESYSDEQLWIHDDQDRVKASILCNIVDASGEFPKLFGVVYDAREESDQIEEGSNYIENDYIQALIRGEQTWSI
jgi:2-oxoglutarate ferredoxin oxidoreductase subunit beta